MNSKFFSAHQDVCVASGSTVATEVDVAASGPIKLNQKVLNCWKEVHAAYWSVSRNATVTSVCSKVSCVADDVQDATKPFAQSARFADAVSS
jgi:hypothetical protein